MPSSHPIIEVKNLSKIVASGHASLTILQDINFSIDAGETIAITGASGSGKSTLLGVLGGLDLPSSGQILLEQTNISHMTEDGRAKLRGEMIGFIFQSFQLLPNLTAMENVMLPLELAHANSIEQSARHWLEEVKLSARATHYPSQLSGGEQQRVAIARAFATQPKILFADEPTGNLDSKTGAHIIDLLFALNQENQTTLVIVTHDQSLAERCSKQMELAGGKQISP